MATKKATKYEYTTVNNLKHYIAVRRAEVMADTGNKVLIRDIEEDLANFCDVSRDTVVMIKRGLNQPALAVAMKMAKYFKVPVEEIFKLSE